jgi:hypothetical protein
MPSKLLIIAAAVAFALLASVAFAEEGEAPELGPFVLPPSDINENIQVVPPENIQVIPPEVGSQYICLQGFGTIKCSSIRLAPDPEDCQAGESLITLRRFGYVSHVCAPSGRKTFDAPPPRMEQ